MKPDVALDPVYIHLFRPGAVAVEAHGCPNPIEQLWGLGTGQNGVRHLAAFLADVPSRGQEIDCKLQPNSS